MSVVRHYEVSGDDGNVNRENIHKYNRLFLVKCSSYRDGAFTVLADGRTPKPYQPHPADPRALVTMPVATRKKETSLWFDLVVPYSSQVEGEEQDPNPLNRRAKITMKAQQNKVIVVVDINGDPILNTATDNFARPLEEDGTEWIFSVQKNMARLPRYLPSYNGALNSDSFRLRGFTLPKISARLKNLNIGDYQIENRTRFLSVTFDIHYREEGWHHLALSRGYRQLVEKKVKDPNTGKKTTKKVLEEILIDGERSNDPLFLDKKGAWIEKPTKKNIVNMKFHTIKRRPFKVLPLK